MEEVKVFQQKVEELEAKHARALEDLEKRLAVSHFASDISSGSRSTSEEDVSSGDSYSGSSNASDTHPSKSQKKRHRKKKAAEKKAKALSAVLGMSEKKGLNPEETKARNEEFHNMVAKRNEEMAKLRADELLAQEDKEKKAQLQKRLTEAKNETQKKKIRNEIAEIVKRLAAEE